MPTRDELTNSQTPQNETQFVLHETGQKILQQKYPGASIKNVNILTYVKNYMFDGKGADNELWMTYEDSEGKHFGGFQVPGNIDLFSEMILPGKERG